MSQGSAPFWPCPIPLLLLSARCRNSRSLSGSLSSNIVETFDMHTQPQSRAWEVVLQPCKATDTEPWQVRSSSRRRNHLTDVLHFPVKDLRHAEGLFNSPSSAMPPLRHSTCRCWFRVFIPSRPPLSSHRRHYNMVGLQCIHRGFRSTGNLRQPSTSLVITTQCSMVGLQVVFALA
jgi:hypothetical protein